MENVGLFVFGVMCAIVWLISIVIALAASLDKLVEIVGFEKFVGYFFAQGISRKGTICITIIVSIITGILAICCFCKIF